MTAINNVAPVAIKYTPPVVTQPVAPIAATAKTVPDKATITPDVAALPTPTISTAPTDTDTTPDITPDSDDSTTAANQNTVAASPPGGVYTALAAASSPTIRGGTVNIQA